MAKATLHSNQCLLLDRVNLLLLYTEVYLIFHLFLYMFIIKESFITSVPRVSLF